MTLTTASYDPKMIVFVKFAPFILHTKFNAFTLVV